MTSVEAVQALRGCHSLMEKLHCSKNLSEARQYGWHCAKSKLTDPELELMRSLIPDKFAYENNWAVGLTSNFEFALGGWGLVAMTERPS